MAQEQSPSMVASFVRWLRLKNYQYEVTFALYMLTPTEKFIFNSLLITLITMLITAAYVYLPGHIVVICGHVWYYLVGDSFTDSVNATLRAVNNSAGTSFGGTGGSPLDTVVAAAATARKIAEL